MSTADLYAADFPHGTPAGYDAGCRSSAACPSQAEHRFSCATAKTKASGDYRVALLFAAGRPVAEIAAHVNGTPAPAPTAEAVPAPARAPKPKPTPRPKPPKPTPVETDPEPALAPDTAPEPAPTAMPAAKTAEEVATVAAKRAPKTRAALIREWARGRGYTVPTRGTIPKHIIEHYEEAQRITATTEAPTPAAEPTPVTHEDIRPADRPDWGTVAESVDVERARRIAVRLEQEAAHWEDRASTAERAVEVLLRRWEAKHATIERLQSEVDASRAYIEGRADSVSFTNDDGSSTLYAGARPEHTPRTDPGLDKPTWIAPEVWDNARRADAELNAFLHATHVTHTTPEQQEPPRRSWGRRVLEFFGLTEDDQ